MSSSLDAERTFWRNLNRYRGILMRYHFYFGLFGTHLSSRRFQCVADIGCGPCPFILWMKATRLIAIDPLVEDFQAMPQWARFWPSQVERHQSLENIPDGTIDGAFLLNLFDHIEPSARPPFMGRLAKAMKSGGWLYVFTHLHNKRDRFHYPVGKEELAELLNSHGFVAHSSGFSQERLNPSWPPLSQWAILKVAH